MKDTWVIGDIHGCLKTLNRLLRQIIGAGGFDKLIFVGDYIDRGPDSKGVLDRIIGLQKKYGRERIITLMGNHEYMCLNFYQWHEDDDYHMGQIWGYNGGWQTIKSFNIADFDLEDKVPEKYLDWMLECPVHYEDEEYFYCHAGVLPDIALKDQKNYTMLWERYDFLSSDFDWGKVVIHGHTVIKAPQTKHNRVSIDTGCVYGNLLTAFNTKTKEFLVTKLIDEV